MNSGGQRELAESHHAEDVEIAKLVAHTLLALVQYPVIGKGFSRAQSGFNERERRHAPPFTRSKRRFRGHLIGVGHPEDLPAVRITLEIERCDQTMATS